MLCVKNILLIKKTHTSVRAVLVSPLLLLHSHFPCCLFLSSAPLHQSERGTEWHPRVGTTHAVPLHRLSGFSFLLCFHSQALIYYSLLSLPLCLLFSFPSLLVLTKQNRSRATCPRVEKMSFEARDKVLQ